MISSQATTVVSYAFFDTLNSFTKEGICFYHRNPDLKMQLSMVGLSYLFLERRINQYPELLTLAICVSNNLHLDWGWWDFRQIH
jgi:hypothetical protein